ncbi:flavin monoamine oxidase family protein [Clostridium peptidivorans]|uniref:flavin monoamine oxidase family protein n=1 Tax=Clostridium peptidivorans TaxID=100174 RepID=UPI000BE375FD|nr:NAD(P)/FAD-dependent oxidoreductase [Clostridium peptidivorans]
MRNTNISEVPYQRPNPTDEERHTQLRYTLNAGGRPEDYKNIIELLSPPKDITTIALKNSGKGVKVAVIGAGEAGLAAAFELKKIGCDITIFEASNRIGGRVYTHYFDCEGKYPVELGAMRIPASHETTWHYINLFKLNTDIFVTRNVNGLFYIRKRWARNDPEGLSVMQNIYPAFNLTPEERRTPWQELVGRIYKKYVLSLPPEIRREIIEVKQNYSDAIKRMDWLSYEMAYENSGLSEDAIAMLSYLSTFDVSFFNIGLIEVMQEAYTADFSFTYRIHGGMQNLTAAFCKALMNKKNSAYAGISSTELGNVNFKMNTVVDGIYKNPDKEGILLECRKTQDDSVKYENFDYIVCAIPFTSLRRVNITPLFSVDKMQAIASLNYEAGQKTYFLLKERFWEKGNKNQRIVGGSTGSDLQTIATFYPSDHSIAVPGKLNVWDLKPGASPNEPGALQVSYNWARDAERAGNKKIDLRIMDFIKQTEAIHGLPSGYIDENMIDYASIYWPNVQYIWSGSCLTKPKDKILFSYVVTQPEMNNRVFFAGEHISQKHAWMQGALQTGMLAANGIAEQIKKRKI